MNNRALGKTTGNMRKHNYETSYNRNKKKLIDVRTKLSFSQVFPRRSFSNKN